jgi:23S rRNA pseudouridine2457 synthase
LSYFVGVLIAFHKPYGVLSQFTTEGSAHRTLAEFNFPKDVYPIGRLDADSEGLLLLSDEPELNERLLHPRHAHEREYWAQVERIPALEALKELARGVATQGRKTLPCRAWILEPQPEVGRVTPCPTAREDDSGRVGSPNTPLGWRQVKAGSGAHGVARPTLPPRDPPIRFRKAVPTCWIGMELIEGKNRQVRHMTAAIGHPTLRLIRARIGNLTLGDLPAGNWRILVKDERKLAETKR